MLDTPLERPQVLRTIFGIRDLILNQAIPPFLGDNQDVVLEMGKEKEGI